MILENICYTELVYGRIHKKLNTCLSRPQIEKLVLKVIAETDEANIIKTGKNYYITNYALNIRLTINSYTFRVITADRIG